MNIKSITIAEGCIACGACAEICPEVFVVRDTCEVLANADVDFFQDWIAQADSVCPVDVIRLGE